MARRAAAGPHIKRINAHHKRHKAHLLKLFHRVRSHPGCYKPGYQPKRGRVPKSLPRKPAGLNKRGSGFWDSIKRGWNWLTGHAKKHVKAVGREVKKQAVHHGKALAKEAGRRASAYASSAMAQGSAWAKQQAAAAGARARKHVEGYIAKGDAKVKSIASKINAGVSKYTGAGSKQGSGWLGDKVRSAFRGGLSRFARGVIRRGMGRRR